MKATFAIAATAALVGGASAASVHNRHVHDAFHNKMEKKTYAAQNSSDCGCTTIYSTWYGEATLHNPPAPSTSSAPASSAPASSAPASSAPASSAPASSAPASSSAKPVTTAAPSTSTAVVVVVPTPVAQTCPTTGVYTFPATTVTLTETTTVCAASTTAVPSGTHTVGGVTTVVTTATTVTCPYATVSTSAGVTTSVIETTTYVCPSAGTYTIAPTTITATKDTTVVVPVVSTYCPGTYTQPEVVTTITETSTVVYCPFDIPATTTTTVPLAYPTSTSPVYTTSAPVAPTTVASSSVATYPASTVSSSTPKSTGGLTGNGKAPWAITYTPYDSNGQCKSSSDVDSDIAAIAASGVTAVRVYSTDCDTLPNVGGACEAQGLKLILGIYIDADHCTASSVTVSEQISAIKSWAMWDLVDLIVVANEAIFNGHCTPTELASLISECKSEFSGYTGYFTTTDTVNVWQQSATTDALCDVIDIVGAQAHAYFNSDTTAAEAGTFVKGQLEIVSNVCPGKEARILETGWPSAGVCNDKACAGVAEQAEAIASLLAEVSQESVFFSLTDDAWKDGNTDCQCEQHWGCGSALGLSGLSL